MRWARRHERLLFNLGALIVGLPGVARIVQERGLGYALIATALICFAWTAIWVLVFAFADLRYWRAVREIKRNARRNAR